MKTTTQQTHQLPKVNLVVFVLYSMVEFEKVKKICCGRSLYWSNVCAARYVFISEVPVGTPAVGVQNDVGEDDDDEPPLNENDDDDLDDVDEVEEQNTQHLVLAQFDKVSYCVRTYDYA